MAYAPLGGRGERERESGERGGESREREGEEGEEGGESQERGEGSW